MSINEQAEKLGLIYIPVLNLYREQATDRLFAYDTQAGFYQVKANIIRRDSEGHTTTQVLRAKDISYLVA